MKEKMLKNGKVKKWLKENGQKILGHSLDIVGDAIPIPILGDMIENIGETLLGKDSELTEDQKMELAKMIEADLEELRILNEDRESARKMQIEALKQDDKFSKRFVYYLAAFWSLIAGVFIFFVTFSSIVNPHMADIIVGFLLGTVISTVITYFFGSSKGSKDKTDIMSIK